MPKFNYASYTQAYQAGVLVAWVENKYPDEFKNISFLICMTHFHSLKEVFGSLLWAKLQSTITGREIVEAYEKFTYQPTYPREMIGDYHEFCLGYVVRYKHTRTFALNNRRIKDKLDEILLITNGTLNNESDEPVVE